jgi:virginiamycin B lyase
LQEENQMKQASTYGDVIEFAIGYPETKDPPSAHHCSTHESSAHHGSTHEITHHRNGSDVLWVTGQKYDTLVKLTTDGRTSLFSMPPGSGPHGMAFDAAGRLWLTLEFAGKIVRVDENGNRPDEYNVCLNGNPSEINTRPHGLGIGDDGETIWFTGKATGTIGKIAPDGKVQHFALPTAGSVPIYIRNGPDHNMWATELVGNAIARITPGGNVTEFPILKTSNSRPIAIVPEPGGKAMWFTEEAGNKVGRINTDGKIEIVEYSVPRSQENVLLAGLSFDDENNLWVQQYVNHNVPTLGGTDYLVKIDKAILTANPSDINGVPFTFYPVPSENTMMHRIIRGPDGNMWFTEMNTDKVGRLTLVG